MKPDEHLPNIHVLRSKNHEYGCRSDCEDHDTPSPMENRKYHHGRSVFSNKCSSQSSVQETPTKFPCIERNSQSVTSVSSFHSAASHLTTSIPDLPRRRLCRSPSCPNFNIKTISTENDDDCRFPSLKPKALTRHNTNCDIKKMTENHRRLMAIAATPRSGPSEPDSPVKNAMLLPLRDTIAIPQQKKKDRKRKKTKQIDTIVAENETKSEDCCTDDLNLSQSDMKCLIWLADVKANQSDIHEVT